MWHLLWESMVKTLKSLLHDQLFNIFSVHSSALKLFRLRANRKPLLCAIDTAACLSQSFLCPLAAHVVFATESLALNAADICNENHRAGGAMMSLETFTLLRKIRLNSSPEVELYSTVFWNRNYTPDPKTSLVHNGHVKTNSSQGLLWLREFREGSGGHRADSVLMLSKLQTLH